MKHNLLISKKYILPIAILGFIIILLGAFFKITHFIYFGLTGNVLITLGTFLSFLSTIIVIIDVVRNKIKNYILWLLFLALFGGITSIIYLIKRK